MGVGGCFGAQPDPTDKPGEKPGSRGLAAEIVRSSFHSARWIVEWTVQSLVDFLIEDSCVICGRARGSNDPLAEAPEGPVRHFLEPVKHPYLFDMLGITSHPVCGECVGGFDTAYTIGILGKLIGPSLVETPRGERFLGGVGERRVCVSGSLGPQAEPIEKVEHVTAVAPFMTNDNALKIMHLVKFRRYFALIPPVARAIRHAMRSFELCPGSEGVLVPTPMEPGEFRRRGFNQAERIATALAQDLHIPVLRDTLKKTVRTAPQSRTKQGDRARNVRGAFACVGEALCGREVLLVDDLVTTGATAASCAAALYRGGARSVTVVCFGRAL